MTAEFLMFFGSLSCYIITLYWVRKRILKAKYAVYWLAISFFVLILGVFPQIIKSIAVSCHLSYPTVLLIINFLVFYSAGFMASMALSQLCNKNKVLIQEIALLEQRMSALEAKNCAVELENK